MQRKNQNQFLRLLFSLILVSGCFTSQIRGLQILPAQQKMLVGDEFNPSSTLPLKELTNLSVHWTSEKQGIMSQVASKPVAAKPGQVNMQFRLFGFLPVKNMVVDVVPHLKVVPGGHSIGVLLNSQGVMVVGHSQVVDNQGQKHFPARVAGIKVGDVVTKINNHAVNNDSEMSKLIKREAASGQPLYIELKRKQQKLRVTLQPVLCKETNSYRIGLFIRDSAAGVGTLTFYHPDTHKYGALGHVITDADTGQKIDIRDGKVVKASIQGIQQGKKGSPGEKIGMFVDDNTINGSISKNCQVGIFGKINSNLDNSLDKMLPVGLSTQVQTGPAEIYTVVDGTRIQPFKINIERLLPFDRPDGKGMIIEVTDERLLQKTGGIVQGMSGSPIIQNGKIIGAVTHVFVNNPAKGYGVYIEKMLFEAGIMSTKQLQKAS